MKLTTQSASLLGCLALGAMLYSFTAQAELRHRYSFSGTAADSINNANGTIQPGTETTPTIADGAVTFHDRLGGFIDLPGPVIAINTYEELTLEMWWRQPAADQTFTMTASFGDTWPNGLGRNYLMISTTRGDQVSRAAIANTPVQDAPWNSEVGVNGPELNDDQYHHYVLTVTGDTINYYIDGAQFGSTPLGATTISGLANTFAYLGKGVYSVDQSVQGSMSEFRIYNSALTSRAVLDNFVNGPDDLDGPGAGTLTGIESSAISSEVVLNATIQVNVTANYENVTVGVSSAPGIIYTSSNTGIATVSPTGLVTGVSPGPVAITATYEGQSDTIDLTVVVPPRPPATLVHRYSFGDAVDSTVLADSAGSANGTVLGNVAFTGTGTAVLPGGFASYIDLPNGIASSLGANGTLEAWVTFPSSGAGGWQRLFDFGNTTLGEDPVHPGVGGDPAPPGYQGDASWFFAPRQGGITSANGGRYGFDPGPGGENPQINPPVALAAPLDEQFHMVATYNHAQRVAQLWINGQLAGQGVVLADRPLSSLNDVNNWLGRSQWSGDANTTATFNEFRMYSGVPSELEIAVNRAAGPDTIIADPGTVESLAMQAGATTAVAGGPAVSLSLLANFTAINGVDVSFVPGVAITSSDPSVARILTGPTRILPVGPGTATISGGLGGQNATPLTFTVTAAPALQLAHRYPFDANAGDTVSGKNGDLVSINANPGGVFEDGGLTLSGNGYVNLPNFLFTDFFYQVEPADQPAVTLELFGSWAGGGNWQRLLDFGDTTFAGGAEDPPVGEAYNGRTTMFITPSNGGVMRFNYTQAAGGAVGVIDSTPLGANQDFHIVVVFDPKQGITRLYRNGVFAGIGTLPANVGTNLRDDQSILDVNVWLGRSNFGADVYYNGRITEFRIWRGGMTEAQARQNYNCGPDNPDGCTIPAAPVIGLNQTGGATTIAWPAAAYGYHMHTTTTLGESTQWTPAAAQPLTTQGVRRFNVNPAGGAAFFQLQTDE